jgi:hypothetical protein
LEAANDRTAHRGYIPDLLAADRALGKKYGVEYAEAFDYVGPAAPSPVDDYVKRHATPLR